MNKHLWENCKVGYLDTDSSTTAANYRSWIKSNLDSVVSVKRYDKVYENKRSKTIKKVIFNDPATIVIWYDGTKTVVKAHDEEFDPEKGLAMAISKKFFGNKGNYFNEFKKWLPKEGE